jgi:hypothetical protein
MPEGFTRLQEAPVESELGLETADIPLLALEEPELAPIDMPLVALEELELAPADDLEWPGASTTKKASKKNKKKAIIYE